MTFCLRAVIANTRSHCGEIVHCYGPSIARNKKNIREKWTGIDLNTPLGKKVAALNAICKAGL
jgi:hypothetical protein